MSEIWRYKLLVRGYSDFDMPINSKIISVGLKRVGDQEDITLWAEVNPVGKKEKRRFLVVFTGDSFNPEPLKFLGTCVTSYGIVSHVYEIMGV